MGYLGAILGALGVILGPPGAVLGPLGAILGSLGAVLPPPVAILGPSWGLLGPSWGHVGAISEPLGANLGPSWRLVGLPRLSKIRSAPDRLQTNESHPARKPGINIPRKHVGFPEAHHGGILKTLKYDLVGNGCISDARRF